VKRVLIIGGSGAGKTTLARRIAVISDLPVTHVDRHRMPVGNLESAKVQVDRILESVANQEYWIIDGLWWRNIDVQLQRADTVIWIDIPAAFRLYRCFRRSLEGGLPGPDLADGFSRRPLLTEMKAIWQSRTWVEKSCARVVTKAARHAECHILQNNSDLRNFMSYQEMIPRPA
jgi:adenylate kinase family enzyme